MNNPLFSEEYRGDYFSDGEHLKPQFVDLWADELGQLFGQENLNKSQMRAFFNETKRLQAIFHVKEDFDVEYGLQPFRFIEEGAHLALVQILLAKKLAEFVSPQVYELRLKMFSIREIISTVLFRK